MKKCCRILAVFVIIISNILYVIWQDFVIVWQNTPCTSPCCGLLTALVLLNSVARWCNTANFFYKNGVILHVCVHGRRKDLSRGALVDFSESFCKGG